MTGPLRARGWFRPVGTLLAALLVPVLVLAAAGCAESDDEGGSGGGDIKVGVVLDLTGVGKSLADPEKVTLEYLTKELNDDGGIDGRKIKLIVRDNGSDDARSRQLANELINQDKVDLLIGATRTATSLPIADLAEQRKVPTISLAAGKTIIEDPEKGKRQWVYKTAQNDSVVVEKMVAQMVAKGYKTMALFKDASAYGAPTPDLFKTIGEAKGLRTVAVEEFDPKATNFDAGLLKLRGSNPNVLVVWGIPPAAGTIMASAKKLQWPTPIMQSHGIGNQTFFDAAGDGANGMQAALGRLVVADQLPDDDPQKETLTKFVEGYKAASGGKNPSTFAGHAYDAFQLAVKAFQEEGTDKQKVRDYLETAELSGVSGQFKMSKDDHSGLTADALVIVDAQNKAWKYAAQPPS